MKIDFLTRYSKKDFKSLCKRAKKLSLDALVMTGLEDNKNRNYKSLLIFPAQEVEWIASLEKSPYASKEDYYNDRKTIIGTDIYKGKALVLLPSNLPFLEDYDSRLYQLLEEITKLGGVTVALQDDTSEAITCKIEDYKHVYPFDAVRIRPYNFHDIHSELPHAPSVVAGSDSFRKEDLGQGKGFTEYDGRIATKEELISAIRNRIPSKLFIHGDRKNPEIPIEKTVRPLRINIKPFLRKIGWADDSSGHSAMKPKD